MAITDNLLHRWEMNEDADPRVDDAGSDNLTVLGTNAVSVPGILNRAVDTSGTIQALQVSSNVGLSAIDAYSVSMWLQITGLFGGSKRAWTSFLGTGRAQQMSIGPTQRLFVQQFFDVASTVSTVAPIGTELVVGTWYHVVYTFLRNDFTHLYIDGVDVQSLALPDEATRVISTPTWSIGGNLTGAERTLALFDQTLVYDRALPQADVDTLYNSGAGFVFNVGAVAPSQNTFTLTEVGQNYLNPVNVQSVRFVAAPATQASDAVVLVDPITGGELWRSYGRSVTNVESELIGTGNGTSRIWPNGFRLDELTGNRGTLYVRIK